MQIDGEWYLSADGIVRPVIHGEILANNGAWIKAPFLVVRVQIAQYSVQPPWQASISSLSILKIASAAWEA